MRHIVFTLLLAACSSDNSDQVVLPDAAPADETDATPVPSADAAPANPILGTWAITWESGDGNWAEAYPSHQDMKARMVTITETEAVFDELDTSGQPLRLTKDSYGYRSSGQPLAGEIFVGLCEPHDNPTHYIWSVVRFMPTENGGIVSGNVYLQTETCYYQGEHVVPQYSARIRGIRQ